MDPDPFLSSTPIGPTGGVFFWCLRAGLPLKSDLEMETARDKSLSPLETDAITIRPKLEDGTIHQAIYERMIR